MHHYSLHTKSISQEDNTVLVVQIYNSNDSLDLPAVISIQLTRLGSTPGLNFLCLAVCKFLE